MPFYNRVETQLLLFMQGRQVSYYVPPPNPATDSACVTSSAGDPGMGALVARGHVHPARKNHPTECRPGVKDKYIYKYGGPSPADWRVVTGTGGCQYIVDAGNIIRYCALPTRPDSGRSDDYWKWQTNKDGSKEHIPRSNKIKPFVTVYPRKVGACVRV
jgi:hypothetical protein